MNLRLRLTCLTTILSFISLFASSNARAQNFDNPGTYMSAISSAHNEMNKTYMAYMSAVAHSRRAKKIEKMRNQVVESITKCKYKIIEVPIYKGDKALRQSSIDYVDLCYKIFNEDYARIVNMEEIAEQSFDAMQAYLLLQEKTDEKIKAAAEKMELAEKEFAAKYNVTLIDTKSELGQKMEVAGKLNNYHNKVYLTFFKCSWQDAQITEALNKKNLNNLEQSRNALITYAKEGLAALDTLKNFQGDAALASACRNALNYYKKMAESDLTKLTDFYLKEENFNKIKKSFEAKSSRTKEEVDAYNKAVNELNSSVNTFNQVNNSINNSRKQMYENWGNTQKSFMDAHMPYAKA